MKIKDVDETIDGIAGHIVEGMTLDDLISFATSQIAENLTEAYHDSGSDGGEEYLIEQAENCGFEITYEEDSE